MTDLAAFRRELDVFVAETLGEEGARQIFIQTAGPALAEFEAEWRSVRPDATFERFVDGRETDDISAVAADGVILERVVAVAPMVRRALELFDLMTRVRTGGYKSQTFVFSGGARASTAAALANRDDFVVIANVSAFARRAELRGFNIAEGLGAGAGLFETIASIIADEFAATANAAYYTWRTIEGRRIPVLALGGAARFAGRRGRGGGRRGVSRAGDRASFPRGRRK